MAQAKRARCARQLRDECSPSSCSASRKASASAARRARTSPEPSASASSGCRRRSTSRWKELSSRSPVKRRTKPAGPGSSRPPHLHGAPGAPHRGGARAHADLCHAQGGWGRGRRGEGGGSCACSRRQRLIDEGRSPPGRGPVAAQRRRAGRGRGRPRLPVLHRGHGAGAELPRVPTRGARSGPSAGRSSFFRTGDLLKAHFCTPTRPTPCSS